MKAPDWLKEYAELVCDGMVLGQVSGREPKLKGRGHAPRTKRAEGHRMDSIITYLPYFKMTERIGGRYEKASFTLTAHWEKLQDAMHACGWDMETRTIVNPRAHKVAQVWWALHRTELPLGLFLDQLAATKARLARESQREDSEIFQRIQS